MSIFRSLFRFPPLNCVAHYWRDTIVLQTAPETPIQEIRRKQDLPHANLFWLPVALLLTLSACGDSGKPASAPAVPEAPKVISEAPFTLDCSGYSGNTNDDGLLGTFSFRITVDGQKKQFWIHETKWRLSYWKPLIAADNKILDLRSLNAETIELDVFGVKIHRTTGKVEGDEDQMQGACELTQLNPIPSKMF